MFIVNTSLSEFAAFIDDDHSHECMSVICAELPTHNDCNRRESSLCDSDYNSHTTLQPLGPISAVTDGNPASPATVADSRWRGSTTWSINHHQPDETTGIGTVRPQWDWLRTADAAPSPVTWMWFHISINEEMDKQTKASGKRCKENSRECPVTLTVALQIMPMGCTLCENLVQVANLADICNPERRKVED